MKRFFKLKTSSIILGLWIACCTTMVSQADSISNPFLTINSQNTVAHVTPGQVLILISFSMPITSLQQWCDQAEKIQAPLVLRGLVQDSFTETQKAVKTMTAHCHGGVVIDPRLFNQYQVTQVPAVIVRQETNPVCLPNQSCWKSEEAAMVMGDVGLENALKIIAEEDNVVAPIAQQKLTQWSAS